MADLRKLQAVHERTAQEAMLRVEELEAMCDKTNARYANFSADMQSKDEASAKLKLELHVKDEELKRVASKLKHVQRRV